MTSGNSRSSNFAALSLNSTFVPVSMKTIFAPRISDLRPYSLFCGSESATTDAVMNEMRMNAEHRLILPLPERISLLLLRLSFNDNGELRDEAPACCGPVPARDPVGLACLRPPNVLCLSRVRPFARGCATQRV